MQKFEKQYLKLMKKINDTGTIKETRNARTKSLFGESIKITKEEGFPLLQSRKIFYKGLLGELAAFMRGPKNVKDFKDQGCNYWNLWADKESGDMRLSYGNEWLNWGSSANNPTGINQWEEIVKLVKVNKYDRRLIISGWNPEAVKYGDLSLPCCHTFYEFSIDTIDGKDYMNIMYVMRSADLAIGVPSNMIMAYTMSLLMQSLLQQNGIKVELGDITMVFGDVHIYEEHWKKTKEQYSLYNKIKTIFTKPITPKIEKEFFETSIYEFNPNHIKIFGYDPKMKIKYKLYA